MNQGATWGKWDLHIHTPASYQWSGKRLRDAATVADRDILLKQVVDGINNSGCAAVAVMDYWTFDGVLALREYLNRPGVTKCNATIFPGIELRMVSPGSFRLNMHVLLNPELSDDKLNAFKTQLKLSMSGKPLTDSYIVEWARQHLNSERLATLGISRATLDSDEAAALQAGSKCAEVTAESVGEALRTFGERDAILFVPFDTNDGVNKIRFREHYSFPREVLAMEAVFEVASQTTRDAFNGVKTVDNDSFFNEFQAAIRHPKLAVRGSDAHRVADYGKFHGGNPTWIKALPTFAGLLQACREPANRSHVGALPPKVDFVQKNPQLFIKNVQVRKRAGAPEPGAWFDNITLPLNQDLVALIGRKGSGKSALADVIGVLGDTPNEKYFSFLSDQRFRLAKDNKASSFEAQIEWVQDSKEPEWRSLSDSRSSSSVPRVKYLPQRYFEELCNDHVKGDDSLLQGELRAVIFSHIPVSERDGADSLDVLIALRTDVIERETLAIQADLKATNARVIQLIEQVDQPAQIRARESVRLSLVGLYALRDKKPAVPPTPLADDEPARIAAAAITDLNVRIATIETQQAVAQAEADFQRIRIRSIDDVLQRVAALQKVLEDSKADLSQRITALGLKLEDVIQLIVNPASLTELQAASKARLAEQEALLQSGVEGTLSTQLAKLMADLATERAKLDGPMKAHQEALTALRAWEEEWAAATGAADKDESFRGKWHRLKSIPTLRAELAQLREKRTQLSLAMLATLRKRGDVLKSLFAPVQALVDDEPQIREALGVQFSVRFSFDAFVTRLFDFIKQSTGSFVGFEESKALASKLLAAHDLTTDAGLTAFLADVEDALAFTVRGGQRRAVAMATILKSDRTAAQLYDFLFGLEYASLSYGLMLGSVELERLSPGQRGALLLIFYLLVDRDRMPIILDQPEENLDNETVYNLLVGVITRAKQHRQVVMVTHNANLAVACDAEQVIVCSMERDGSSKISYEAGAVEELNLNQSVVTILEGTKPAFENRRRKYL
ncbi:TrlF family AAA-like ATPase [Xanthomonas cannabis]|uniref:TrlF family AAA-like ATPase n=1 Tax=Xanthomonas cannabis TaxID=1885674 RepID=UPI00141BDCFC|nr:ABC transporter [Xanthomonas cannabis]NIK19102.1 ABC-type lipoprotein export system ATPase subunit [Xanthomonas cannabis]